MTSNLTSYSLIFILTFQRLCRPQKFEFAKETDEKTKYEYNYYTDEIKNLAPLKINQDDGFSRTIFYQLQCTMVDGKTCNALTNQKSSKYM